MRIRVTQETTFAFSSATRGLHLALRLTPRSFDTQYVLKWRVGVDLDASLRPREDAFGAIVHSLSWHKPIEKLTVLATGEVETTDAVGVVRGAVEPLQPEIYLRASPLAHANAGLREFTRAATAGATDTLDALHKLMAALHREIAREPGFGGETPANEIFALKKGGAADLAHVFVACAREAAIPARFVTGYRLGETGPEMFAWAEAHTAGLGWVGFDAAHDECPNDSYIRVAAGLDANDAAPWRLWRAGADSTITATLRVEQAGGQSQN